MTVNELIERLKTVDGDLPVRIGWADSAEGMPQLYGHGEVGQSKVWILVYDKPEELGGNCLVIYGRDER